MVFKRLLFVAVTLCLMAMPSAFAQDIIWSKTYGFPESSELGLCGNLTSDGGYVISGVSYHFSGLSGEFWLVRTRANGDTIWTRNYGGDRWQESHYVIQTDDGGFALCGGTNVAVGDDDLYVVKTDSLGNTLWTRSFGVSGEQDDGQAIIQTSDGGYLAVGSGWNGVYNTDLLMVRMDSSGNVLWTKLYGPNYVSDYAYGVVETADSGFAITGTYASGGASDLWLLRTYPNGDTMWTRMFDFNSYMDRGDQIVMTSDGGFAIGGRTFLPSGDYRLLILRTDSLGNEIWHREFAGLDRAFAESIDKTSDGGFVIAGGTRVGYGSLDYYVVRTDSTGDSLWAAVYDYDGVTGDDEDCFEVKVDAEGNIIAFGYADIDPSGYDSEYWMLKIADSAYVSPGCDYVPGDINGDGSVMGNDVTYGVRYFKGIGPQPPDSCWNDSTSSWLYSAGDVNGSCLFTGSDITFLVAYFKGYNPEILWCPQTPPAETSIILIKDEKKTPAIIPKE